MRLAPGPMSKGASGTVAAGATVTVNRLLGTDAGAVHDRVAEEGRAP